MPMYAIPNLLANSADEVTPWNHPSEIPEALRVDKDKFREWANTPTTTHCFYSAAEGISPMVRVSGDNPAVRLHGMVVDYDASVSDAMLESVRENSPVEYVPNYACKTFSGGARLVWQFSEPLLLPSDPKVTKEFLKHLARKMRLTKFLPGLDTDAFYDVARYYERGREWKHLCSDAIPIDMLHQWLYEASKKVKWDHGDTNIPLNAVKEEIDKQYPGAWAGPFDEGCRGRRFWDGDADNSTASIVRPGGMQCFTGGVAFVAWREILGPKFVSQFEADRTGKVLKDYFFDGKLYWREDERGQWIAMSREDFRLRLRARYGMEATASKHDPVSVLDRATYTLQDQKQVTAALPFVHHPPGLIRSGGALYLNTSVAKCMTPAESGGESWGDGFPFLAEFLNGLFVGEEALPALLAWWKRFYEHGLSEGPVSGQAMFIAGEPGVGKTFLSTVLISRTVGGHMDASRYLLGEEPFSAHVLESPVMAVDDTAPASDYRRHIRYSAAIKKMTANHDHVFNQKFLKAGRVTWLGRIVVTCNLDGESIKLLPDMDLSLMEKVMLLRCRKIGFVFPPAKELMKAVEQELPYLCQYLLNMEVPEELVGTNRFGVSPYHDPYMLSAARQSSPSFTFLEILYQFMQLWSQGNEATHWKGTCSELLGAMALDESLAVLVRNYTPQQVASLLGQLKSQGFPVTRKRTASTRQWNIPVDILAGLNSEGEEDAED